MRLKHKIYYIAIGVILLAVFQVGFQLIPRLAFADSHGAHEAESKPEPIKIYTSFALPQKQVSYKTKYTGLLHLISKLRIK